MANKVFPDNTVLCNFAVVHRTDLLRDWLRGRGRWTEAVEGEARKSARVLPGVAPVLTEGWLGEALVPESDGEEDQILTVRRAVFGGRDDEPTKHLGEAMTLVLIKRHADLAGSWWVSDDQDALDYARRQRITARDTMDVMAELVAEGALTARDAFALMKTMRDRDRHLCMPERPEDLQR